jgi:hypothetical protein
MQGSNPVSFMQTPFSIAHCTWTGNRASRDGGSVFLHLVTAPVNFVDCDWNDSIARGTGGTLYAMTAVVRITITVGDSAINGSTADRGGALYSSFVQLELISTTITHTQGQRPVTIGQRRGVAAHALIVERWPLSGRLLIAAICVFYFIFLSFLFFFPAFFFF